MISQYNSNNYNSKFTVKQNNQNIELANGYSIDSLYKHNLVTNFAKNNNLKLTNTKTENYIKSINNSILTNFKLENNILKNMKQSDVTGFASTENKYNNQINFAMKEVKLITIYC